MTAECPEVLEAIVEAWWKPTNWDQFGHEVGAILTQAGIAATRPGSGSALR